MGIKFIQKVTLLTFGIVSGLSFLVWYSAAHGDIVTTTFSVRKQESMTLESIIEESLDWNMKQNWERNFQTLINKDEHTMKFIPTSSSCQTAFKPSLSENLKIVENYSFKDIRSYAKMLTLEEKGIDELLKANQEKYNKSTSLPVLVTAASSEYFKVSQGLIRSYHNKLLPLYKDLKMIFYDIGLTEPQRVLMKKYCRCEIRTLNKDKFPEHLSKIRSYSWKPVIIQLLLKEYELVMWADSTMRFLGSPLDNEFQWAREKGIQVLVGSTGLINIQTKKDSFEFLKEDPCLYSIPEIQTGLLIVNRNKFILTSVMKPWVSCALSYGCMTFDGSFFAQMCLGRPRLHQCHRFDQSILSIILTRLFNENRSVVENNFNDVAVVVRKGVEYFKNLTTSK